MIDKPRKRRQYNNYINWFICKKQKTCSYIHIIFTAKPDVR